MGPSLDSRGSYSLSSSKNDEIQSLSLRTIRILIADLVQQFNGGHPGGAIGMVAIGVALYKYVMNYSPNDPEYFNRDRFVLSNGHTCLFQYVFNHLVGYKHMTMEQLKTYHSAEVDSYCTGHPEIEQPGIEVTTGPLGQGIANAVGLAMAAKNLAATYNKPGHKIIDNTIWCMIGDACLQEGVALEAISLAGHFRLNNLVVMYDNNQITCDGTVDVANDEDINAKMRACGWNVIDIEDGCYDIDGIVKAMETAKLSKNRPTLLNIRTIIGLGSLVEGDPAAHGASLGEASVNRMKVENGFDINEFFHVPQEVYEFFSDIPYRGDILAKQWNKKLEDYKSAYPELGNELSTRIAGELSSEWESLIPSSFPTSPTPSRKSNGLVLAELGKHVNSLFVGTADLAPSINLEWDGMIDFQSPELKKPPANYAGRFIHWGIREFAMAAISNGIAAYNKGTFIPVTSSFFMFYIYAAPAVRMGALQNLQVVHIATHDSIGAGEDGPTHQPVELAAFYRAMPNLLYIRPADGEETAGAWIAALQAKNMSTILSLSRHNLPQYQDLTSRQGVLNGAYVLREREAADVTIIGVGSEMRFAVEAATLLEEFGYKARLISFPCQKLFENQSSDYKRSVLHKHKGIPSVVIEAYVSFGWERYADAGVHMKSFGKSLPGPVNYRHFGFDTARIAKLIDKYIQDRKSGLHQYEYVEL